MVDNTQNRKVITGDGSVSVYMDEYGETMHTTSGAYEEAYRKHILPSGILSVEKPVVRILDVGFGLGYNTLCLIEEMRKLKRKTGIEIVGLEYDRSYSDIISSISFSDSRETIYRSIKSLFVDGFVEDDNWSAVIVFGDARKSVHTLKGQLFDAVFHDPFSPSKNPELWTVEFFRKIASLMNDNAVLTTYSSAFQIRRAMFEAGLNIGRAPSSGPKKEGTAASKSTLKDQFAEPEIISLLSEIKSTPYRDTEFSDSRESILARRLAEMAEQRAIAGLQAHRK